MYIYCIYNFMFNIVSKVNNESLWRWLEGAEGIMGVFRTAIACLFRSNKTTIASFTTTFQG